MSQAMEIRRRVRRQHLADTAACAANTSHVECQRVRRHLAPQDAFAAPTWDGLLRMPQMGDTVEVLAQYTAQVLREAWQGGKDARAMVEEHAGPEFLAQCDTHLANIVAAGRIAAARES